MRKTPPGPPPGDVSSSVRELSIEIDGETSDLTTPPNRGGRSSFFTGTVVAGAILGALVYGFMLGKGDRDSIGSTLPGPSAASTTVTPATPVPAGEALTETQVAFVRASPGHDIGGAVTEFLDANHFRSIAVDSSGLVWAGGPSGLVRLDPATGGFTTLTDSSGKGPLDVRQIAPAPDGSVWVATSRGLSHWDGQAWDNDSKLSYKESKLEATALAVDSDGTVWLATHRWSWTGQPEEEVSQLHWDQPPFFGDIRTVTFNDWITDLEEDPEGDMWALVGGSLWRYDGQWHKEIAGTGWLQQMTFDARGDPWVSREGRLLRWDGTTFVDAPWHSPPPDLELGSAAGQQFVHSLASGPTGTVWVLFNHLDRSTGQPQWELAAFDETGTNVRSLPVLGDQQWYTDLSVGPGDQVWLAAESTIVGFVGGDWVHYQLADQPPLGSIHTLAVGVEGDLWLANEQGIFHEQAAVWHPYDAEALGLSPEPDQGSRQYWVITSPEGTVWGGQGCGAARLRNGAWLALPPLPDRPAECWEGPLTATSDALWMRASCCSIRPTTFRWDGTGWQEVDDPGTHVNDLAVAEDGTTWIASDVGVHRSDEDEWRELLTGVTVARLAIDSDGSLWAVSSPWSDTGGLWHYQDEGWSRSRPGELFLALERSPGGEVWALLRRDDGASVVLNTRTGRIRSVVGVGDVYSMAVSPDGTVWLGGNGRLYRVDPLD